MIDIRNNDVLGPKTRMTFNLVKGAILAIFVILDQVYFHLNGYLFLALLVGLFIVMEFISKVITKIFYW